MKTNHSMARGLMKATAALFAAAALALLYSCALPKKPEPQPKPPTAAQEKPAPKPKKPSKPGALYEWNGNGAEVSHIEVSIDEQKARFYSGGEQVGWTVVASGIRKYPTPAGDFEVIEKVSDKRSNLYGKIYSKGGKLVRRNAKQGRDPIPAGGRFQGAKMPYFIRLTNDGIGLHGGPIPRPGRRASHGCIRMPYKFAPILFRHVDLGTRVSIIGNAPSYASYLAKQRRNAPKRASARVAKAKTVTQPTAQAQPPVRASQPRAETAATAPAMAGVAPTPPFTSPTPSPDAQAGTGASSMAGSPDPMPHQAPATPVSPGAVIPPSQPETSPAAQAETSTKATIQTQPSAPMSRPSAPSGSNSTTMSGTSGPIPNTAAPVPAPAPASLPQSPLDTSSSTPAPTTTAAPSS